MAETSRHKGRATADSLRTRKEDEYHERHKTAASSRPVAAGSEQGRSGAPVYEEKKDYVETSVADQYAHRTQMAYARIAEEERRAQLLKYQNPFGSIGESRRPDYRRADDAPDLQGEYEEEYFDQPYDDLREDLYDAPPHAASRAPYDGEPRRREDGTIRHTSLAAEDGDQKEWGRTGSVPQPENPEAESAAAAEAEDGPFEYDERFAPPQPPPDDAIYYDEAGNAFYLEETKDGEEEEEEEAVGAREDESYEQDTMERQGKYYTEFAPQAPRGQRHAERGERFYSTASSPYARRDRDYPAYPPQPSSAAPATKRPAKKPGATAQPKAASIDKKTAPKEVQVKTTRTILSRNAAPATAGSRATVGSLPPDEKATASSMDSKRSGELKSLNAHDVPTKTNAPHPDSSHTESKGTPEKTAIIANASVTAAPAVVSSMATMPVASASVLAASAPIVNTTPAVAAAVAGSTGMATVTPVASAVSVVAASEQKDVSAEAKVANNGGVENSGRELSPRRAQGIETKEIKETRGIIGTGLLQQGPVSRDGFQLDSSLSYGAPPGFSFHHRLTELQRKMEIASFMHAQLAGATTGTADTNEYVNVETVQQRTEKPLTKNNKDSKDTEMASTALSRHIASGCPIFVYLHQQAEVTRHSTLVQRHSTLVQREHVFSSLDMERHLASGCALHDSIEELEIAWGKLRSMHGAIQETILLDTADDKKQERDSMVTHVLHYLYKCKPFATVLEKWKQYVGPQESKMEKQYFFKGHQQRRHARIYAANQDEATKHLSRVSALLKIILFLIVGLCVLVSYMDVRTPSITPCSSFLPTVTHPAPANIIKEPAIIIKEPTNILKTTIPLDLMITKEPAIDPPRVADGSRTHTIAPNSQTAAPSPHTAAPTPHTAAPTPLGDVAPFSPE